MLPNHLGGIPKDIGYLLEAGASSQQTGRQRAAVPVGVGFLYAGLLEHGGKCPLSNSNQGTARCLAIPEEVWAIAGRIPR
jgi:hypothetical protein